MNSQKHIEITLCISGSEISFNFISKILELSPTSIRDNSSLNHQFLSDELNCKEWCYTISKKPCNELSIAFTELLNVFSGKEKKLLNICSLNNANITVIVVTDFINDEIPELTIPVNVIAFLNEIKAELCFDIYSY